MNPINDINNWTWVRYDEAHRIAVYKGLKYQIFPVNFHRYVLYKDTFIPNFAPKRLFKLLVETEIVY